MRGVPTSKRMTSPRWSGSRVCDQSLSKQARAGKVDRQPHTEKAGVKGEGCPPKSPSTTPRRQPTQINIQSEN